MATQWKTMTLAAAEFIRRFLLHVLPKGLRRIRHYGLLANGNRAEAIAKARELLAVATAPSEDAADMAEPEQPCALPRPSPCCGGRMIIIEIFARGETPKCRPSPKPPPIRIDTS
jgi:hypothetical protein